ncbi:DUF4365 domain-containing protein [Campylobacter jejuni]|nr:DUF4365 domain-containing protein [Campylobacter jejuni]
MSDYKLPREAKAHQIGRNGERIFSYSIPLGWIETKISPDNGLDYLIQYEKDDKPICSFFVQLKSTMNEFNDNEIFVELKTSTINFCCNCGIVMVVACDLVKEKCYYEFLDVLLKNKGKLSKKYNRFVISRKNEITKNLDIFYELEKRRAIQTVSSLNENKNNSFFNQVIEAKVNEDKFTHLKNNVYISAYIPYKHRLDLSMLVMFNIDGLDKNMFTPSKDYILEVFFSGYKADLDKRKWIAFQDPNDKEKYMATIGFNSFFLSKKTCEEFANGLDKLFDAYFDRMQTLENNLKACFYPKFHKYKNAYKLIKIDKNLWEKMILFIKDNENKKAKIRYYLVGNNIRVDFQNKEKNVHGNLIISPEIYRDDVILIWNSLYWEFDRFTSLDLEKSLLNVEDAHKWLFDEFIPLVIYDYERKKDEERFLYKIFNFIKINKTLAFHDFIKNFKIREYIKSDYKQNDMEFLLTRCESLQSYCKNHNDILFNNEAFVSLYEGLLILIQNCSELDIYYIYGNLGNIGFCGERNRENLIMGIKNYLKNNSKFESNCNVVDLILRNYVAFIRDNKQALEFNITSKLIVKLQNIIKISQMIDLKFN